MTTSHRPARTCPQAACDLPARALPAPAAARRHLLQLAITGAAAIGMPALLTTARAQGLSPGGRPKGEDRSAQHEGTPVSLRPTPSQTEGPFYPVEIPADNDFDLLRNGRLVAQGGSPAWVEGSVSDTAGRPVRGAVVEIWQCDAHGHYHHPGDGGRADPAFQGFGRVAVEADGRWRFRTLRPAPYSGRTPHIHVKVRLERRELLTTQLYVEGDPGNERDGLWRRLRDDERSLLTVPFRPGLDGLQARFPIVVAV